MRKPLALCFSLLVLCAALTGCTLHQGRASAASAEISSAVLGLSGRRRSNGRLMKCVSRISGSMIQIATCNGRRHISELSD